jgi:hypothetical protein
VVRSPVVIAPLFRRRTAPSMTSTFMDEDRSGFVPERLWRIADVAAFLCRCENTARKIVKLPDTPAPVFVDGDGAVWDPRAWWAWAERRTVEASKAKQRAAAPRGRNTRV